MRATNALVLALLLSPSTVLAEPYRHDNLALGPDVGVVHLVSEGGARILPSFAFGGHLSLYLGRFVTVSPYYRRTDAVLRTDGVALGLASPSAVVGSLSSYSLGLRVEPTWPLGDHARVWAVVGSEWGVLDFPSIQVAGSDPYTLATPHQTFVHFPFGLGGHVGLFSNWLAVEGVATAGPVLGDSGSVGVQSIAKSGVAISGVGLPGIRSVLTGMVSVVVEL